MSVITLFAFDNPQVKTGLRLVIDRVIEGYRTHPNKITLITRSLT